ncbi:hypothetical protein HPP92_003140 [Vanilla planifolia]|uniref:RING-type domain-containing protein n=1 Tax=Vanilla planifolia TaxID=51239 RepID=A0A835RZF6_VANPL|nr:hypothetical protein HPP92_003140 [Vanilla planifolia]
MSSWNTKTSERMLLLFGILLNFMAWLAGANLLLIGKNLLLSFNDLEANFAPSVKESGEIGVIHLAEPLNACTELKKKAVDGSPSQFVLILRGSCTFDDKVRNAQSAGFRAAIVYDNEDGGSLISRTPGGIHIYAMFISKASGETLKAYVGQNDIELWIIPTFENSVWSVLAITFISLLAMSALLAACFFLRRQVVGRQQRHRPNVRVFHGMSSQLVKAMPSVIVTSVREDEYTPTCAICLEDYSVGEKLRILPCYHKFHEACVDTWLTSWRTFCPICKQVARTRMIYTPASESTPLLGHAGLSVRETTCPLNLQRSYNSPKSIRSSRSSTELGDASIVVSP